MTAQLIVTATRQPNSDDDYNSYLSVAGPLMMAAGGTFTANYTKVDDLAGNNGPEQVIIVNFPDESAARSLFQHPEYQKVIPLRDRAFSSLSMILATSAAQ